MLEQLGAQLALPAPLVEQAGGLYESRGAPVRRHDGMPSHVLAGVALLAAARLVRRHAVQAALRVACWPSGALLIGW